MSAIDQIKIQWECQQLLNQVLLFMDNSDWFSLVDCYTDDAELARPTDPTNLIKGRDSILASFQARSPKTTCHLLANSVFTVQNSTTVTVTSRAFLMTGPAMCSSGIAGPVDADPVLLTGTFRDTLVKVNELWLIQKRVGSIELKYRYPE